jgi:hypothetical protein
MLNPLKEPVLKYFNESNAQYMELLNMMEEDLEGLLQKVERIASIRHFQYLTELRTYTAHLQSRLEGRSYTKKHVGVEGLDKLKQGDPLVSAIIDKIEGQELPS